jgi:hypothetical protein
VKAWCALGLTRLGEGAPARRELLASGPPAMRRLAALAFAEAGDDRGLDVLEGAIEVAADLPTTVKTTPGKHVSLVFYVTQGVAVEACVVVPLRRELAKEAPKERD